MPEVFDEQWGFAVRKTGRAVVLGEWGGSITSDPMMKKVVGGVWAGRMVMSFKARGADVMEVSRQTWPIRFHVVVI